MLIAATSLACTRGGLTIFRHVNFTVGASEALMLTGPNGSGKTTLLRVIAGLLRPSEGTVGFAGAGLDAVLGEEAHYLAHLDPLKPSLTVAENLTFWTEFLGGAAAVDEPLGAVRLERLAQLPAAYLSAGQRRRLSLARLLAVQRPIWLLDEPTAALDARAEYEVFERFNELTQTKMALFISHRFSTVRMAERIIVLENGAIAEEGNHDQLIALNGRYADMFEL
ncbi:MAG: heme ABC exporter ATP-binding protein CcmA, partial [Xanthobacteraceae bacterium]|nr:heme ABC exporter ATP-binding protein CcmA [Xanthobacteraceae bacterium]